MINSIRRKNAGRWLPIVILLFFLTPIIVIISSGDFSSTENWAFFKTHLLPKSMYNTLYLTLIASLVAGLIGFVSAYLVTFHDFFLGKWLQWLFILPMAIPPYIGAYVYAGIFSYTGRIQMFSRELFGVSIPYRYLDVMNVNGAIAIYSLLLYPYVYLIVRAYLSGSATQWVESARVLGLTPLQTLYRVVLPLSRPSLVAGIGMVMMEVISDYGVVQYFGIKTLGTDIFSLWFGNGDLSTATRVSSILLLIVIALLIIDTTLKGGKKYHLNISKSQPVQKKQLKGVANVSATLFSLIIVSISFIIPILQLLDWGIKSYQDMNWSKINSMLFNTISAASVALLMIIVVTFYLAAYTTRHKGLIVKIVDQGVKLGYSIPGAVIGIGVMILFVWIDRTLAPLYAQLNLNKALFISSSIIVLYFAYTSRFLLLGYNSFHSGFIKDGPAYNESARLLGYSKIKAGIFVDVPMQRFALISASILIFVDILKELPLTLMLRPFNYETLATKTFEYANDERLQEAAIPALIIILISVVGIIMLSKIQRKKSVRR